MCVERPVDGRKVRIGEKRERVPGKEEYDIEIDEHVARNGVNGRERRVVIGKKEKIDGNE